MFDLTGKTALVTGATGAIGDAIARALHKQGATVAISGTRREALDTLAVLSGHAMDDGIHVAGCVPSGVASNNRWTCVGSPDRRWDGVPV